MPTDPHLTPDEDTLAQLGYELEDVEYRTLKKSVLGFFIFVVFCGVAGVVIFGFFIGWNKVFHPPATTAPFVLRTPAEPNPLLQTNTTAKTDIAQLRQHEDAILHGPAAWVDKGRGIVRIPVDQAIDLYLKKIGGNPDQPTTIVSGAPPVEGNSGEASAGGSTGE